MRIAHVSDCYLPRTGGIETQVRGLSQAQRARGDQPLVVTATPAERGRAVIQGEVDDGVPIHRLAVNLPAGLPVTPHVGRRLSSLLTDSADVVHIHGGLISPFAWPALATTVRSRLPCVVSVHSMWDGWSTVIRMASRAARWHSLPVVWTTVSRVAAQALRAALGPRVEVRLLHNGIDLDYWHSGPRPAPDATVFTVVAVTRLAQRKRPDALVDVLGGARAQVPEHIPMRALVVGDGPDRAHLERVIRSRGMDWVRLLGWRNHQQIREVFAQSDAFLSATRLESFGIAALEARTFGLPVVGLACSGINEFITHGREGLLAADDSGLATAIAELATDPVLAARITQHNRSSDPAFGWPAVVTRAEEHYRLAIQRA